MAVALTFVSATALSENIQPRFIDIHNSSNLSSMGDRHYSPSIGRFISLDKAKNGFAEYNYTNGNPIAYSDPSGLGPGDIFRKLFGIAKKYETMAEDNLDKEITTADLSRNEDVSNIGLDPSKSNIPEKKLSKQAIRNQQVIRDETAAKSDETLKLQKAHSSGKSARLHAGPLHSPTYGSSDYTFHHGSDGSNSTLTGGQGAAGGPDDLPRDARAHDLQRSESSRSFSDGDGQPANIDVNTVTMEYFKGQEAKFSMSNQNYEEDPGRAQFTFEDVDIHKNQARINREQNSFDSRGLSRVGRNRLILGVGVGLAITGVSLAAYFGTRSNDSTESMENLAPATCSNPDPRLCPH